MGDMQISVSIPVDADGFIRRECPSCMRHFKWYSGETEDRPENFIEPEEYTCPYCGTAAGKDSWWTTQQLEYAQEYAASQALGQIGADLEREFRRGPIKFKASSQAPDLPPPLVEPNDMMMVAPPCHDFEPLKVAEDWDQPLHCLMCGALFRV
ncbi:hypothetical protein [Micromonospora palomenae]|uniref:hypothetical protein n=1 Tax=Micromonospora palomenae TaxID=1461247 RepID=UPI003F8BDC44